MRNSAKMLADEGCMSLRQMPGFIPAALSTELRLRVRDILKVKLRCELRSTQSPSATCGLDVNIINNN